MSGKGGFRPGGQWSLASITMMVCVVVGLFMGRPDVVVLGLPLAFAAASGWSALRPPPAGQARSSAGMEATTFGIEPDPGESDEGRRTFRVASGGPSGIALIQAAAAGGPAVSALVLLGGPFAVSVPVPRSGRARVLTVGAAALTLDGVMRQEARELEPVRLTVLPRVREARLLPLPHRLQGRTGEHTSRSIGDGGELRSIDEFRPGDQLRRIDWRATARQSANEDRLFVRRSYARSEAGVHLVLDTAHDYPARLRAWFPLRTEPVNALSSLHLAREAATLLAASYLAAGDRVGLNDLSARHWPVRATGGHRQLELIRTQLALMTASGRPEQSSRDPGAPAGSLIYVMSTFTDEEPARLMGLWQAAGHRVIGVDILPALEGSAVSPSGRRASCLVLLRRREVMNAVAVSGMAVLGYRGGGSIAAGGALDSIPGQLPLETGLASLRRPTGSYRSAVGGPV
ncbi:DUF58 domain-containing protein [Arthrobacter sp. EH-1B-1]|uniref:DUF58 domain-containing protein n=1 Tax=Arthrobacter vasquezii TaxID=2977629 RepID=A0ABT6CUR8_9MICC|nr:DUF58 domain-containing protein [Arthrobacter vasquezii]MDF9277305.1 DUF58 domain-containing protein [Arthrobacter vasquezii]